MNADKKQYRSLLIELYKEYSVDNNNYLETFTVAFSLLLNLRKEYSQDRKPTTTNRDKVEGVNFT